MRNKTSSLLIAVCLAFAMLATRGSHTLTPFTLPDASLIVFMLGGLWLRRWSWFAAFFGLGAVIDFGAAALDPAQGFCLTNGYWGMIPASAALWLCGLWLSKHANPFALKSFIPATLTGVFVAFVISTQTYYLYSGRFPSQGLSETIQHGWNYLHNWMLVNFSYAAIAWLIVAALRSLPVLQQAKN